MWKLAVFPLLASVVLQQASAQGGAESLAFPGYLPGDYVKSRKPVGDDRPNDVYEHLGVRRPVLTPDEVVIYPHHFGFEYGQDTEQRVYEVHSKSELLAKHDKKHSKHDKHGKHGNQGKQVQNQHHNDQQQQQNNFVDGPIAAPHNPAFGSWAPPPQQQFRPRPAFPPVHRHFG